MQVHPLLLSTVTTPDWHPIPNALSPVYAYLILHPDGLVLVDTGVGSGSTFIDAQYRPAPRSLSAALAAHDASPADIRFVINTHLHFDHCGQNASFRRVPIYVQAAELEAARAERYTVRDWVDFEGARYEPVVGDVEVATGIKLLLTPSHTPGHQAVAVEGDEGLILIAAQAAETMLEFESADACRALRALHPARVYLSHEHPRT